MSDRDTKVINLSILVALIGTVKVVIAINDNQIGLQYFIFAKKIIFIMRLQYRKTLFSVPGGISGLLWALISNPGRTILFGFLKTKELNKNVFT